MKPPKEYLKNLKHHTITKQMLSDCIYSINNRALNSRDNEYKYTHYIPNTYGKGIAGFMEKYYPKSDNSPLSGYGLSGYGGETSWQPINH